MLGAIGSKTKKLLSILFHIPYSHYYSFKYCLLNIAITKGETLSHVHDTGTFGLEKHRYHTDLYWITKKKILKIPDNLTWEISADGWADWFDADNCYTMYTYIKSLPSTPQLHTIRACEISALKSIKGLQPFPQLRLHRTLERNKTASTYFGFNS